LTSTKVDKSHRAEWQRSELEMRYRISGRWRVWGGGMVADASGTPGGVRKVQSGLGNSLSTIGTHQACWETAVVGVLVEVHTGSVEATNPSKKRRSRSDDTCARGARMK
jgi:hypothetical protein